MNLGTANITALNLGTTSIPKAYLGTTQVFSSYTPYTGTVAFLCIGQSNMIGRADYTTGAKFPSGVYQYNQAGSVVSLAGAYQMDFQDDVSTDMTPMVNFAIDFMAENPDATLVFIPAAVGGTGFITNHWNQGDTWYNAAKNRANAYFTANPTTQFLGFLWHQGENDALTAGGAAVYQTNLDTFIDDIRTDVTVAEATSPFVLGGFSQTFINYGADYSTVNSIVLDTPNRKSYTSVAEGVDLTLQDTYHFNEAGVRIIGSRYYTHWKSALVNGG